MGLSVCPKCGALTQGGHSCDPTPVHKAVPKAAIVHAIVDAPVHKPVDSDIIGRLAERGVTMADLEAMASGELVLSKPKTDRKTYLRERKRRERAATKASAG